MDGMRKSWPTKRDWPMARGYSKSAARTVAASTALPRNWSIDCKRVVPWLWFLAASRHSRRSCAAASYCVQSRRRLIVRSDTASRPAVPWLRSKTPVMCRPLRPLQERSSGSASQTPVLFGHASIGSELSESQETEQREVGSGQCGR